MTVIYNDQYTTAPMTQNIQKIVMNVLVGSTIDLTVFVEGLLSSTNQSFALALTNVQLRTCDVLTCKVPHGSGLLIPNGDCRVNQCDPNYAIDDNACFCVPQKSCGNGVYVQCIMASNSFPPCPGGTIIVVETENVSIPALIFGALIAWSFIVVCIFLGVCVCVREKPLPPMRKYARVAAKHVKQRLLSKRRRHEPT
jgi:hypothetical protein